MNIWRQTAALPQPLRLLVLIFAVVAIANIMFFTILGVAALIDTAL